MGEAARSEDESSATRAEVTFEECLAQTTACVQKPEHEAELAPQSEHVDPWSL